MPTVVAWGAGDPVATKLIDSLAHPGGNITGIFRRCHHPDHQASGLVEGDVAKNFKKSRCFGTRDDLGMTLRYEASAKVAQSIGISVQALGRFASPTISTKHLRP